MAKKSKKNLEHTSTEPWEKSIYETEYEPTQSRTEQRKIKKGNTTFITLLVVLIVIIIAVPTTGYLYFSMSRNRGENTSPNTEQTTNTTDNQTDDTNNTDTTDTQTNDPADTEDTQTDGENQDGEEQAEPNAPQLAGTDPGAQQQGQTPPATDAGTEGQQHVIVEPGEGLGQISNRTGVPVEEIARLNGITINPANPSDFYPPIQPGQELRVH